MKIWSNEEIAKVFFNGKVEELENFVLNAKQRNEERIERWKREQLLNRK